MTPQTPAIAPAGNGEPPLSRHIAAVSEKRFTPHHNVDPAVGGASAHWRWASPDIGTSLVRKVNSGNNATYTASDATESRPRSPSRRRGPVPARIPN